MHKSEELTRELFKLQELRVRVLDDICRTCAAQRHQPKYRVAYKHEDKNEGSVHWCMLITRGTGAMGGAIFVSHSWRIELSMKEGLRLGRETSSQHFARSRSVNVLMENTIWTLK